MYSYLYTNLFLFLFSFTLIYISNHNYIFTYLFQIVFSFAYADAGKFFLGTTLVCQWLGSRLYLFLYQRGYRSIDLPRHYKVGNNNVVINPAFSAY